MFLVLLCAENFEAGIVLDLILTFEFFESLCSYNIVLIKKECSVIITWGASDEAYFKRNSLTDSLTDTEFYMCTLFFVRNRFRRKLDT